jgi:GNAT superfamily N-acetyltransferase
MQKLPEFVPVVAALPAGFEALRAAAQAEGYRHIDRLAAEWVAGTTRFAGPGEALLMARMGGELAAIGGITIDPHWPDALRMRRFYVRKPFRRSGIGRLLAENLLDHAGRLGRPVVVNAAAGSEGFWEALGFLAAAGNGHTHVLRAVRLDPMVADRPTVGPRPR